MRNKIVPLFPEHKIYTECYGGGASLLLAKKPSPIEIYNDLNHDLVNFFQVLRDNSHELLKQLFLTPYSREEFRRSFDLENINDLERARRFFVRHRQSMGGAGKVFSCTTNRVRRGMADVVSGFLSNIDENLELVVQRLRRVQIECMSAVDCIKKYDKEDCLHYIDCPYVHSTRKSKTEYGIYEMTDKEHEELADVLNGVRGKVVLSGYHCELYDRLYATWRRVKFDMPNNSAKSKKKERRTEICWLNF